jgi:hypothetical protein
VQKAGERGAAHFQDLRRLLHVESQRFDDFVLIRSPSLGGFFMGMRAKSSMYGCATKSPAGGPVADAGVRRTLIYCELVYCKIGSAKDDAGTKRLPWVTPRGEACSRRRCRSAGERRPARVASKAS